MSTAVLIVNFRGYDDLDRCLDSLESQLRPSDEVIVVDHGSDPSQLVAMAERHRRIVPIPRADNPGFAAGVNLAARHARAAYLCLLNPDTLLHGPVLSVMEDWLDTHPRTAVVGPRLLNADGSTQPSARSFPGLSTVFGGRSTWLTRHYPNNWCSRRNLHGLDSRRAVDVDWVSGACLMTRRTAFERLGGLDESFFLYWEDADYCRRVAASGGGCTYLPWVAVSHPGGGSSKYNLPQAIRTFHASAFRFFLKHSGAWERLAAPVVRIGLFLRGELRVRQALWAASRAAATALRRPASDSIAEAPQAYAEVEQSVQGV